MARRPDLAESMIAEIITLGDHWLVHTLDLDAYLPDRFRRRLAAHRDKAVRSALVIHAATAPREMPEQLIDDPDPQVRERLPRDKHIPSDLRGRLATDADPASHPAQIASDTKVLG
ncbi:hypothetical protein OH779_39275 [Actinacidiphila glaucinigra]|uniref:hypothetical protein n=1 Tax=Actinacidiphila glaucinigra TaxID=235986 RepID=UPI0038703F6E